MAFNLHDLTPLGYKGHPDGVAVSFLSLVT